MDHPSQPLRPSVAIRVTFDPAADPPLLFASADPADPGFQVTPAGDVTVESAGSANVTFLLDTAVDDAEIEGLQLGWFGPPLTATDGAYPRPELPAGGIPESLPYRLADERDDRGRVRKLVFEDLAEPPCDVIAYQLYVRTRSDGRSYRIDPKIYRKGVGDVGSRRPAGYD